MTMLKMFIYIVNVALLKKIVIIKINTVFKGMSIPVNSLLLERINK